MRNFLNVSFLMCCDITDQTVFDLASDAAMKQLLEGGAQQVRCPSVGIIQS